MVALDLRDYEENQEGPALMVRRVKLGQKERQDTKVHLVLLACRVREVYRVQQGTKVEEGIRVDQDHKVGLEK